MGKQKMIDLKKGSEFYIKGKIQAIDKGCEDFSYLVNFKDHGSLWFSRAELLSYIETTNKTNPIKRKPIAISSLTDSSNSETPMVICDDGSVWLFDCNRRKTWIRVDDIPQD